jgi:hypothetical protein
VSAVGVGSQPTTTADRTSTHCVAGADHRDDTRADEHTNRRADEQKSRRAEERQLCDLKLRVLFSKCLDIFGAETEM